MPQIDRHVDIMSSKSMFMSSIQIHKDHQTINSILNRSDKTVKKNSSKIPKIKGKQLFYFEKVLTKLITRTPYPNFRFFCPYCASLDIFITMDKTCKHLTVECLDCKKSWIDSRS